jgi:hypothetical protein
VLYLLFEPTSEDYRARLLQNGPAEICFGHADLHSHWFAFIMITAESQLGQRPVGLQGKSI